MAIRTEGQSIPEVLGWCCLAGSALLLQLALAIPTLSAQPTKGGVNPWLAASPPPLPFVQIAAALPLVLAVAAMALSACLFFMSASGDQPRRTVLGFPVPFIWGVAGLVLLPGLLHAPLAARSMLWLNRYHRQEHARIAGYQQFVDQRWSHERGWSGAFYSSDGQRVYTYASFGSLKVWNAHSGVAAPQDIGVSLSDTINVAISGDGQRIACIPINSRSSGKIFVYDRSGGLVAEFPAAAPPAGGSLVFTRPYFLAGNKLIAVAYRLAGVDEGEVGVWDIDSGQRVLETHLTDGTSTLAISPDGAMLGVVDMEKTQPSSKPRNEKDPLPAESFWTDIFQRRVWLYSASDLSAAPIQQEVVPVERSDDTRQTFYTTVLAIAPGGKEFAITAPAEVLLQNAATGEVRQRLKMPAAVAALQFDLSGKRLAAVGAGEFRVWNCDSGEVLAQHAMPAHSPDESPISPDLRTLIYMDAYQGGIVFRMSLVTGKELMQGEPAPEW